MKNNYLLIILFCYSLNLFSQIPVGYNHTPNGKPIIGNYHTYLNNEFASVEISLENESSNFEKGVFVLKNSKTINKSYINYLNNKISTKPDTLGFPKAEKYKAEEIEYFKLGIDSFFVVNKIKINKKIIEEPTIIKHVATFDDKIYAQYYEYNLFNGALKNKFFIQLLENSNVWSHLKIEGEPARKFLMNYNKFIDNKELTEEEFLNSVKEIQFHEKLKTEKPIHYDASWQELKDEINAKFTAKVISKKDSIYTLDYFNNKKEKIYQVSYSSLNPIKKTGKMNVFSNNKLTTEKVYSNDSLMSTTYFHSNGNVKLKIVNKLIKNNYNVQEEKLCYVDIINNSGEDIINGGDGSLSYEDLKVIYKVNKEELSEAYYLENNIKNNFFVTSDKNIKTTNFESLLKTFLYEKSSFKKARLNENLEGTILVDITTDFKGRVVDYKIMNLLNNKIDNLLERFCKAKMSKNNSYTFRFKGIKLEDKNSLCRFILPISFTHKRFHKTFTRANYDMHHMMFHHMMIHQQMNLSTPRF